MGDHPADVLVRIPAETGADARELEALTTNLRRHLLELDVDEVSRPRLDTPAGARGVDVAAVGTLMIKVVTSSKMLTSIIGAIRSWLSSRQGRSIKIEIGGDAIEVTGVSSADQERLVSTWIERHSEG